MRIPVWLTLAIAIVVILFGIVRIRLGFRTPEAEAQGKERRGFYALGNRTHLLVGVVYLLLGGALIATSFGWNPFGGLIGPKTEEPTKDTAPSSTRIPIDQLPKPK